MKRDRSAARLSSSEGGPEGGGVVRESLGAWDEEGKPRQYRAREGGRASTSPRALRRHHRGRHIPLMLRLLCADDDADIRAILSLALAVDPEISAQVFADGVELVVAARAQGADAILLDAMMPGQDGFETCRQLKADPSTAAIPVLFLTATSQRAERERALTLGAVACLAKPFDPMTLAAGVRAALRT